MAYLVISDIHGNAEALTAVLEDAGKRADIGKILCLGDIAGYGAQPDVCLATARESGFICVKGNHDMAVTGEIDTGDFNDAGAEAVAWQSGRIPPSDLKWLKGLPLTLEIGDFTLAHGSPRDPVWEYVETDREAAASMSHFKTKYCFVGHTHCPVYFVYRGYGRGMETSYFVPGRAVKLSDRMVINPGGVGQPRDGDPRASYLLCDVEKGEVTNYRVTYDVNAAQNAIRQAHLPDRLAQRLQHGR